MADPNIAIAGLPGNGPPRSILDAARSGAIALFASASLPAERDDVLGRAKFAGRLVNAGVAARDLVLDFSALAFVVELGEIDPVITADPDDDAVLARAPGARASRIVSGDRHLLDLKQFRGILILRAADLVSEVPR